MPGQREIQPLHRSARLRQRWGRQHENERKRQELAHDPSAQGTTWPFERAPLHELGSQMICVIFRKDRASSATCQPAKSDSGGNLVTKLKGSHGFDEVDAPRRPRCATLEVLQTT
jgi:hypothetical protein